MGRRNRPRAGEAGNSAARQAPLRAMNANA